jgi:hypothetical protein
MAWSHKGISLDAPPPLARPIKGCCWRPFGDHYRLARDVLAWLPICHRDGHLAGCDPAEKPAQEPRQLANF